MGRVFGFKGLALAAVLSSGMVFAATWQAQDWRYGEQIAQAELAATQASKDARDAAVEIEELRDFNANVVAEAGALRRQLRASSTQVVTSEVVKYVQTAGAHDCGLDADGVRIHDLAASGGVPEDPGTAAPPDGQASPASNSEVIQVVTANYQACHGIGDQLIELQQWVAAACTDPAG